MQVVRYIIRQSLKLNFSLDHHHLEAKSSAILIFTYLTWSCIFCFCKVKAVPFLHVLSRIGGKIKILLVFHINQAEFLPFALLCGWIFVFLMMPL